LVIQKQEARRAQNRASEVVQMVPQADGTQRGEEIRRTGFRPVLLKILAGDVGIEPTITVLETDVIPFHQSPFPRILA
jgi:hypothetical protein